MPDFFRVEKISGNARLGRVCTSHAEIETPVFMPVGTAASVKGVPQETLEELGAQIILGNTYHLYLRPGVETVRKMGLRWISGLQPQRAAKNLGRRGHIPFASRRFFAFLQPGERHAGANRAGRGHRHGVR
jgi:hypothetical protein